MIAAVNAAINGKASHGVLTLQGDQGLGKGRWIKALVDPEWVCEGRTIDVQNRDTIWQIIRYWICEIGELGSTFRKSDIDALKAFITRDTDEIRLPYAATNTEFQRRTVF